MEKVLNQEEIDAMVRAARGGAPRSPEESNAIPWDARQAGQIRREHLRSLSLLHEGYARNLTHSLGAYLRTGFEATLVSAEHLTYRDFLQRLPELTYLASCRLTPVGVTAVLQLDLAVAFSLIDLLLGGDGTAQPPTRSVTEIEQDIMAIVMRIICREWQRAWEALALEFQFEERQEPEQVQGLHPPEEKVLALSFELNVVERRGTLNLAVPVKVSGALLRKISESNNAHRGATATANDRLHELLLPCHFLAELALRSLSVPVRDLLHLGPGSLLSFPRSATEPGTLAVTGLDMFRAGVARAGAVRAARVLDKPAREI